MTRHQWRRRAVVVGARVKTLAALVDTNDRFFFIGLAIAIRGGWLVSSKWTMVVAGVVLMAIGLLGLGGRRAHSR
jgi:hypothetical protein